MMVIKAILLLIIELLVYWLVGTLVTGFFWREKKAGVGIQAVIGFLAYQILFQVCAFPFIITKRWFTELVTCWTVLVLAVLAVSIFLRRKDLVSQVKGFVASVNAQPLCFVVAIVAVVIFGYYAMMNGRLDDDSVYYIGLANTTVDMDVMFRSNVYTGAMQPSLYLRRIFTTFEINAAALAKIFDIHPIIVMRVTRVLTNVVLSAFSLHAIGTKLYVKHEYKECQKKSMTFMIIALYSNFLMEKTIFTNGTFLLHRTYEGKAFAAGTLVLFTIYLCIELTLEEQKKKYIWLLILLLWASTAISSTAVIINLAVIVIWVIACLGMRIGARYWKQLEE